MGSPRWGAFLASSPKKLSLPRHDSKNPTHDKGFRQRYPRLITVAVLAGFRQPRNLLAIDYDTLQVAAGLRSRDGKEEASQGGPGGRQYFGPQG